MNDRYAGRTPLLMDQIRAGEYVARVELPGYQVWTRTILINPDRTAIVQANLTSLQRYGSISVRSNENNAEIYLDGQYKGLTEKNRSVLLEQIPEGFHDIRVNLGGYIDWSQRVEVKPNQRVQLTVNLEKIKRTASIEIISDISNARIYLDGKYLKTTTANKSVTIDNIKEGSYELRITKDDYQDYVTMVNLVSGQIYHINVTMRPIIREGAISINCNESSAKVFINGKQMITTTANQVKTITGLKEGSYEVTVIKDGFRTWIDELWVYPGETTSAYVNLSRLAADIRKCF